MTIANIITASAAAMGVATCSIINQAEALDANHPRLRKLDADNASSLSLSMPSKIENIDNVGSALIEEVEPKSSLEAVDTGILSSKASKSSKGGKGSKTCPLDDIDGDGSDGIIAANAAGRCYLSAEKGGLDGYVCRNKPCVYSCDCFGTSSGVSCSGRSGRKKCTCETRPNSYKGRIGDCCESNRDCGTYNCSYFSPNGDYRCAS